KTFYKKRFLSIYPMFWIAYLVGFAYRLLTHYNWQGIPKHRILYSILGLDGLFIANGVRDFYVLGEWFLGFIILFYIVFPVLRAAVKKNACITLIFVILLALITMKVVWRYFPGIVTSTVLFVRLPEIVFGMVMVKWKAKPSFLSGLISLAVIVANTIIKPSSIPMDIQVFYVGVASFFVLSYLASLIKSEKVMFVFRKVGNYSYAVFLVHHLITDVFFEKISMQTMTRTQSYVSFLGLCVIIGFCAWVLYHVNALVLRMFRRPKGLA
ncbi:MAG TPA: acyltransferase family protein, partial [Lachnospiraceae bacterium]